MKKQLGLLFLATFCLVSCNTTNIKLRVESLDDSIEQYNTAWRWALYNRIASYHRHDNGQQQELDTEKLTDIRVTGYAVSEKTLNDEASEARVRGEIDYYNTRRGTLQKLSFDHQWWYDPELKAWFNGSEVPVFE